MTEMSEADRKLAQELLAAWDGSSAHRPAIEQAVNSMSEDAVSMAQTARRLIAAELAATPMADEDALVETMAQAIVYAHRLDFGEEHEDAHRASDNEWPDFLPEARGALDAMRPHIAALQARAEAAEAENARLREALEQIDQPIACGCSACRSDCQSDAAKAIYFEKAREIARAALGDKS